MKAAAKITIKGTVQGVFFRNFVKAEADKLGLKGFVRNLEDGNVEVIVEGGDEISKLVEVLKQGPPHAQIRDVGVEERKWSGEFDDFRVLRF